MKELSINEKAKAYDETIERAKKLYGNGIAEEIFPELKESQDEKIRKWIIDDIRYNMNNEPLNNSEYKKKAEKAIAWLEKQGKQLADKNEPRFEVGDWVVFITSESVYQVEKKENYEYTLRHILGGSMCLPFSNEKLIREWTIQDAKDGDVICYRDEISLYKHDIKNCTKQETTFGGFVYYCCYDGKRFITDSLYMLTKQDEIDIHPATKEQRDVLMKVMNDAGYEWDSEKKELKKLVPNKFDPKTLQVFDKVLVRLTKDCIWNATFFSHYDKEVNWGCYPCVTTSCKSYGKCIPYNDETKHLLGTSDEAPEYYRYWED